MTEEKKPILIRINQAAKILFGESNDTYRKRIRKMIDRDILHGTRLDEEVQGSPWYVTSASLDAWIAQITQRDR